MIQNSKQKPKISLKPTLCIACLFVCIFSAGTIKAQNRAADSIFTIAKDTLLVKISEVSLNEVKYHKIVGDTAEIHSVSKTKILKIIYGNGDIERFDLVKNTVTAGTDTRYELAVNSAFQQEIANWPTERLQTEKREYRAKANSRIATGVVTVVGGSILFAYGLLATAFGDSGSGIAIMASGLAIGAGLTIPLHISGAKNRKKYKSIREELIRRGVESY